MFVEFLWPEKNILVSSTRSTSKFFSFFLIDNNPLILSPEFQQNIFLPATPQFNTNPLEALTSQLLRLLDQIVHL